MKKKSMPYKKMIACLVLIGLVWLTFLPTSFAQDNPHINIIPYPQKVVNGQGSLELKQSQFEIGLPVEADHLFPIIEKDFFNLYGLNLQKNKEAAIQFKINPDLAEEEYTLEISDRIYIRGKSASSLLSGWASLLQLVQSFNNTFKWPKLTINDQPHLAYRGLLVDVARKFQSIASLEQIVDMCRWYKINYIQLHLNDDQLFVFPSDAYPNLATKGSSYSKAELLGLVKYAQERGVVFVPELDAPGHTGTMRKAYPELFGTVELGMLDVANPKAIEAVKVIAGEMMEVFHTSPYFHIGADEVWMRNFEKLPRTIKAVQDKGFDNPHDLYLDYIIQMHEYVKSKGLQTIMWESFKGKGSKKVTIPNEILVYAWETMYQTPTSLRDNGYTLLNASWKPVYITPTIRWTLKQIYDWNIWRWEHFLPQAPAWNSIQFMEADHRKVVGTQLCAWEMTEEMTLPAIQERLAGLSENAWNVKKAKNYDHFKNRFDEQDQKLTQILFPGVVSKSGVGAAHERFYNHQNVFKEGAGYKARALWNGTRITYTTDGSVPSLQSREWTGALQVDSSTVLRLAIFRNASRIGYRTELLEHRPLNVSFEGALVDTENPIDWIVNFDKTLSINIHAEKKGLSVHYTLDGSKPTMAATKFQKKIVVGKPATIRIQAFDSFKRPVGIGYSYTLKKKDTPKS